MSLIEQINAPLPKIIKAVVFDIGGVLVEINRNWEDALLAAGIRNGVVGHLSAFPSLDEFQISAMSEDDYIESLRTFLKVDSAEHARLVHNLILKNPYPGTLELIEDLNRQGLITACLSNTNEPHWVEMTASGKFPNIEALKYRVASFEVALAKPDLEIFRAFEDLSGCLPNEIVFFDDIEENVEASRERGWRGYWIDHTKDTADQMELILIAEGAMPAP